MLRIPLASCLLLSAMWLFSQPAVSQAPAVSDGPAALRQVVGAMASDPLTADQVQNLLLERFGLLPDEQALVIGHAEGLIDNLALIRQEGAESVAAIDQHGSRNLALIVQTGGDNFSSVEQTGDGNVAAIRIDGYDITLGTAAAPSIRQLGDENVFLLDVTGSGYDVPPSVQQGNQNQAVQIGTIGAPFGIEQYGDGLTVIVIHNE